MAHNFNTIEGTEVFNVNDAVQGSHALTLDDVKNFVVAGNTNIPNAHIVATAPYDPLNPLAGWTAPSNPIQDNTVEVKFTDGTVGNYTFDGSVWVQDFINKTLAQHDLRLLANGTIERGSDSATDPKGAQFLHNSYSHLNGFSDNWVGANGEDRPVLKLQNNGIVWMSKKDDSQNNGDLYKFKFDPIVRSIFIGSNAWDTDTHNSLQSVVLGYDTKSHGNYNVVVGRSVGIVGSGSFNIGRGTQITNLGGSGSDGENINLGAFNTITNAYRVGLFGNVSNIINGITSYYVSHNSSISSPNECQGFVSNSSSNTDNKLFSFGYNLQTSNTFNSGVFGSSHNLTGTNRVFSVGSSNYSNGNLDGGFLGRMLHQSGGFQWGLGFNNVSFVGQNANNIIDSDLLFSIGNGKDIGSYDSGQLYTANEPLITKSNALTILKNGSIQVNNIPSTTSSSKTQNDVTPVAALEVVSTTKGFLPPRMTEAQANIWISSFNTTTDVTGLSGTGDEKHSRQGEMVYCIDCIGNDSTVGVTLVAQWNGTSWLAKKMW